MELQNAMPKSGLSASAVLTKAAVRAAAQLQLSNAEMARVIGVSPPTITRMRRGQFALDEDTKPFELAVLFVRVYRSLDAIVGGDDAVAAKWLRAPNIVMKEKPVNLVQKVMGLIHVLQYLDTRRAVS
jgi:predicted transcriptional regulator